LKPISILKAAAFAAALIPAAALAYRFYRFFYAQEFTALPANPGDYITDQTGTWALALLVITLTVTPLRRLTKWNDLVKLRRMLGLFSFFYATLHMLTWVVFVNFFDVTASASRIRNVPMPTKMYGFSPTSAIMALTSK